MDHLPKRSELRAATDQGRVDFLQTDLELCFTFTDLAITELEMDDREAAQRLFQKAETGYATMTRIVQQVDNAYQKDEIAHRLIELRTKLDDAHAVFGKD
jgi:hypothetical protein